MKTLKKTLFALLLICATTPVLASPAVLGPSPIMSDVTVKMTDLQATGSATGYSYKYHLVFHNASANYASCAGRTMNPHGSTIFTNLIVPPGKDVVATVSNYSGYEDWKLVCHEMFPQPEQALPVPGE